MIGRRGFLGASAAALAAPHIAAAAEQRVPKFVPQADLAAVDPVFTSAYVTRNHTGERPDAQMTDIPMHRGGTYLCMEGPQFSTRAESFLYRSWDCSVIGMTAMPEDKAIVSGGTLRKIE